jgi:hypothetical protein
LVIRVAALRYFAATPLLFITRAEFGCRSKSGKESIIMKLRIGTSFLLFVALLAGCGGGGTGISSDTTAYAGSYRSDFTRAGDSVLLVVVKTNGSAKIAVSDGTGVIASGNATVTPTGAIVGTASGSAGSVTLNGSIDQSATLTADLGGAITAAGLNASKIADAGQTIFAGAYSIHYSGSESGTADIVVSSTGAVSGTVHSPSVGSGNLVGQLDDIGSQLSATSSGTVNGIPYTATWTGTFYLTVSGAGESGAWHSSSGYSGTHTGTSN